jgi:hypothetical protein
MQEIENDPALDGVSSETFDVEICGPDQINLEILDLPGQRTMDGLNQSRKIDALAAKFARNPDNYVIAVVECKADAATLDTLKCIHDQIMAAQFDPTEGVPPPYTRKEEWIHRALIVVNKFDQILHRDGVATTPALKQCIDSYRRHLGNNFVIAALRANNMGWNDSSKLTENLQQANELEQTWLDKVLLSTEMDPGMRHAWDTWKYSEVFGQPVIVRRLIERWQSTIDHQMCNIESVLVRAVSKSESIAERLRKQLNYLQKDKPWLDQSVQKCLYSYWHDFCSTWRTLCDPCTRGCIPHHEFAQSLPEVPHQLNLTSCLSEHDSTQYEESIRIWKSYSTSTHSHFYRGEDVSCDLRADLKHAEEEWQRWHVFQQFARRQLDAASSNDDGAQLEQHSLTYLPFQDSVRQIIADFEACYAQRDLLRAAKGVDAVARLWKVFLYFIHGYSASTVSDDELRALRDPFTNTYSVNAAVSMVRKRMLMDVLNGMQPFIGTLKGMFRRYPMHVHRLLVGAYTDVHRPPKYRVLWGQQAFQDAITELFYRKIDERLDRVQTMWERNVRAMADSMAADLPIRFLMGYMSTPHEDMLLPSRSRDPPPRATSEIASHIRALPQDNGVQLVSADSPDVVKLTREEQKRDVLRTVRHELRDMFHITEDDRRRAVFGAVDMAVGANMQPEPQNPSNPNTEYIRNCAQEYYYLGMFMVRTCAMCLDAHLTCGVCACLLVGGNAVRVAPHVAVHVSTLRAFRRLRGRV